MHLTIAGPANPAQFAADLPRVRSFPEGMGGTPVNALVRGLLSKGCRVSLITGSMTQSETWRAAGEQLDITAVPFRPRARDRALDLFAFEREHLATAIMESKPDVVHAHWTYEFALAAYQAAAAPVLVTARDAPLTILRHMPDPYRLIRAVMAYRARAKIKHLTAISPEFARRWRRQMLYWRPIRVIPNPLPALHIDPKLRSTTPVVLGVGDDSRRKNFRALLRAFPAVLAAHDDAQLRLVGPGLDPDGAMANWAREHGLDRSVTFVGPLDRTQLSREYSTATVFCHPSLEESFGNVIVEALIADLPVVAGQRSGGVPWVLFDGQAGLLVDVRKPQCIADGLITAIRQPELTVAPGFDLPVELHRRYSVETVAAQYLEEYARVICAERQGGQS